MGEESQRRKSLQQQENKENKHAAVDRRVVRAQCKVKEAVDERCHLSYCSLCRLPNPSGAGS